MLARAGSGLSQSMLRFLFKAAHDPSFNSDAIMNQIRLVNTEGNGGHLYGTTLTPQEKDQLLEYLKTL